MSTCLPFDDRSQNSICSHMPLYCRLLTPDRTHSCSLSRRRSPHLPSCLTPQYASAWHQPCVHGSDLERPRVVRVAREVYNVVVAAADGGAALRSRGLAARVEAYATAAAEVLDGGASLPPPCCLPVVTLGPRVFPEPNGHAIPIVELVGAHVVQLPVPILVAAVSACGPIAATVPGGPVQIVIDRADGICAERVGDGARPGKAREIDPTSGSV
mmetsp:Transcript_56493/g.126196  ORF Transcript_56493/g.126196 Transcript_56493/m.126196 type:complete len:214 (-) Transcript_56493:891-1532(-)